MQERLIARFDCAAIESLPLSRTAPRVCVARLSDTLPRNAFLGIVGLVGADPVDSGHHRRVQKIGQAIVGVSASPRIGSHQQRQPSAFESKAVILLFGLDHHDYPTFGESLRRHSLVPWLRTATSMPTPFTDLRW
jgi:hypothetical protein